MTDRPVIGVCMEITHLTAALIDGNSSLFHLTRIADYVEVEVRNKLPFFGDHVQNERVIG
jgi:hypothetical protein